MKYLVTILITAVLMTLFLKRCDHTVKDIKTFDLRLKYSEKDYKAGCLDSSQFFCKSIKTNEGNKNCLNQLDEICKTWAIKRSEQLQQDKWDDKSE